MQLRIVLDHPDTCDYCPCLGKVELPDDNPARMWCMFNSDYDVGYTLHGGLYERTIGGKWMCNLTQRPQRCIDDNGI